MSGVTLSREISANLNQFPDNPGAQLFQSPNSGARLIELTHNSEYAQ